jgi:hypothetical protein
MKKTAERRFSVLIKGVLNFGLSNCYKLKWVILIRLLASPKSTFPCLGEGFTQSGQWRKIVAVKYF